MSTYLPHEIIEIILSYLPVKSLLQFQTVCKRWAATISDSEFARLHFKNKEFRQLPPSDYTQVLKTIRNRKLCCHCEGLYLIQKTNLTLYPIPYRCPKRKYVLRNPSRRSHRTLRYPCHLLDYEPISGICYDPLLKDYKVVIGDTYDYAVFYCKTKSWSEIKDTDLDIGNSCPEGVSFDGSVYWLRFPKDKDWLEIVYFDGRDEKLKKMDVIIRARNAYLISSHDALYLFLSQHLPMKEILFMKNVGGGDGCAWMEIKAELPFTCRYVTPFFCYQENKIIFRIKSESSFDINYLLYDEGTRSFTKIQDRSSLGFIDLLPYVENLYLL